MNNNAFTELTASIKASSEIKRGTVKPSRRFEVKPPNVRTIRQRFAASQNEFANMLGVSVDTIQNWEQGRCFPTGPARVLLFVADRNPYLLKETLSSEAAHKATRKRVYVMPKSSDLSNLQHPKKPNNIAI